MVSAEIPVNTINRQLSARKYGTEGLEEFMKKKSTLATQIRKKKKQRKATFDLKKTVVFLDYLLKNTLKSIQTFFNNLPTCSHYS